MEHITGETTLAQLAVLRGKLGVTGIHLVLEHARPTSALHVDPGVPNTRVKAIIQDATDKTTIGYGDTEAEALDDAFCRLTHLIGIDIITDKKELRAAVKSYEQP